VAVYKASCTVKDISSGRTMQASCTLQQRNRATDWKFEVHFCGVGVRVTAEHLYNDTPLEGAMFAAPDSVRQLAAMHKVFGCRESDIELSELVWK